jgi:hypothetical protein
MQLIPFYLKLKKKIYKNKILRKYFQIILINNGLSIKKLLI